MTNWRGGYEYCEQHERPSPCPVCYEVPERGNTGQKESNNAHSFPNGKTVEDVVKQPSHYTAGGIETIDYIAAKLGAEALAGYLVGNCLKYLSRAGRKDDALQDYKKAQVYLGWLIKHIETGSIK